MKQESQPAKLIINKYKRGEAANLEKREKKRNENEQTKVRRKESPKWKGKEQTRWKGKTMNQQTINPQTNKWNNRKMHRGVLWISPHRVKMWLHVIPQGVWTRTSSATGAPSVLNCRLKVSLRVNLPFRRTNSDQNRRWRKHELHLWSFSSTEIKSL